MFLIGCAAPEALEIWAEVDATYGTLVRVRWEQAYTETSYVEATFDGETIVTPERIRGAGPADEWVLGVPYDTELSVRVVVGDLSATTSVSTAPVPAGMPLPVSVEGDPERWDPQARWFLLSLTEGTGTLTPLDALWWVMIVDREGRAVWARRTDDAYTSLHPRISSDGTAILIDQASWWAGDFDDGAASEIVRMRLDGRVESVTPTPGLHHPYTDLADGTLVWGARTGSLETIETVSPSGERARLWDCAPWLETIGARLYDNCGSNTLAWSDAHQTFLWSSFSLHTIVELDADGQTLRWFGNAAGSILADPPFHWQHGVHWTEAGTLLVSEHPNEAEIETVVREYTPDGDTLTQSWSFAEGDAIEGRYLGEAHRLGNGATLHNTGSEPRIREATPEGEVVWDITWNDGVEHWLGRSTPIADLYALVGGPG